MNKLDRPQTIKTTVWSEFSNLYIDQLGKTIRRKFSIDCGIEGDFTGLGGKSELIIRFLASDDDAASILKYMTRIWQFVEAPELVSQ
ncbi:MAG: hypothetical protein L0L14_01450 [Tetragenococcus koreensis]|nr:hypothetical protein [Tetragenococcus koreensis]